MSSPRSFFVGCLGLLTLALSHASARAEAGPTRSVATDAATKDSVEGAATRSESAPTTDEVPDAQTQALELKARADELFRIREYLEALELYERAYALFRDPRVLYNSGRALQALGRYGDALQRLLDFRAQAPAELRSRLHGFDALLDDLRQRVCEVRVSVNLPGARVSLGSEVLGESPLAEARFVNAGQRRLQVHKEGYFPVQRDVVLRGGGAATYDIVLESKAQHGKLIVLSEIPGTTITVGGTSVGQAPTEVVLPPGTHRVLAHKEDHDDIGTQVVLEAGQQRTITLDPLAPALYERWWFWGGVGVVAAAAVITVIAVTPSPVRNTDGDFSPSAISAPLVTF